MGDLKTYEFLAEIQFQPSKLLTKHGIVSRILHCFVLCLVGDCGKIIIFAIFTKFATFAIFFRPLLLFCALPCCRLWQNCHFRHICQIHRHFLFSAIFVVAYISRHISNFWAKKFSHSNTNLNRNILIHYRLKLS